MSHIVYTRSDGGVNLCHPAPQIVAVMGNGGWFGLASRGTLERHIEAEIAAGRRDSLARRYIHALAFGGCTEAEAFAIIRDRDCAQGVAHEVIDLQDLPQDRWFRNAWRRSHNGGPIGIDMKAAKRIQLQHIRSAAQKAKAELELPRWRERIRRAASPAELRMVWPRGLKTHG